MSVINPQGLVSLVVAVTGHRDLHRDDIDDVSSAIKDTLRALAARYPSTPIRLITGMAEGADLLAVDAVLELQMEPAIGSRIRYTPILPMPLGSYLTSFESEEARARCSDLVDGQEPILIPPHPGSTPERIATHGTDERRQQYRDLVKVLVESSQILIAVWDGTRTGRAGGTAEAVTRKLGEYTPDAVEKHERRGQRRTEPYGIGIQPFGTGPVIQISARRMNQSDASPEERVQRHTPSGSQWGNFDTVYLLLDEYNRDVLTHPKLKPLAVKKYESLIRNGAVTNLTPAMAWSAQVRAWAAALSEHYKHLNERAWKLAFVFIFACGLLLHGPQLAYTQPNAMWLWIVVVMIYGAMALAILGGVWENGRVEHRVRELRGIPTLLPSAGLRYRRKHEDYRALAEALRVQYYWLASGLNCLASESYMDRHAGDMIWVRDATSEVVLLRFEEVVEPNGHMMLSRSLGKDWLSNQLDFFKKNTKTLEHRHRRARRAWLLLAIPTAFLPLILLLLRVLHRELVEPALGWLELFCSTAMLMAVLGISFAELQGYEQEAKQYEQMCAFYTRTTDRLQRLQDQWLGAEAGGEANRDDIEEKKDEVRDFLWCVGKDALAENSDWLAMHRGRNLKLSHGSGG